MKRSYKLLIIIISIFVLSAFRFYKFEEYETFWDWNVILLPLIFLIIPAFIIAFFVSSLLRNQFEKTYFIKISIVTNAAALAFAICYIIISYYKNVDFKNNDNIVHNNNYKNFYGDSRDTFVTLAINAVEQKQKNKNDYKIYRMRVLERDTFINDKALKYYDVNQIYILGKNRNDSNTYVSRQIVYDNKKLQEIYNKSILVDSTGFNELKRYNDEIFNLMKIVPDSIKNNFEDDWKIVKLKN